MGKLYSVKEIAELTGLTKAGIQKAINKDPKIEWDKEKNKTRLYSAAKVVTIIERLSIDFDCSIFDLSDEEQTEEKPPTIENSTPPTDDENRQNIANSENSEVPTNDKNRQNATKTANSEVPTSDNTPTDTRTEEVELIKNMLSILQEQLHEKDKQLMVKDKQIQDLSDRLAEAMALTKGQQYIAAADKTTGLLEADTRREQAAAGNRSEEPQEKKSFWKRLFGN